MHEFSICQGLLRQLCQVAEKEQLDVIDLITIKVGSLSGVEVKLLATAFEAAKLSLTITTESKLNIVETSGDDLHLMQVEGRQLPINNQHEGNLSCAEPADVM